MKFTSSLEKEKGNSNGEMVVVGGGGGGGRKPLAMKNN